MTDKHTPGPWNAEHLWNGIITIKAPTGEVATLTKHNTDAHSPGPHGINEAGANARLIAAAPELLAALNAMVRKYAPPDDGYPGSTPAHEARAAIAKATSP